jgi:hypothetical protein
MSCSVNRPSIINLIALGFIVSCVSPSGAKDLLGLIAGETISEAETKLRRDLDDTIGSFLSKADQTATQLLNKGTNSGSLLTIQAANQMAILSETMRSQFGDELGKKLASASLQARAMLIELQRWRDSVNELNDKLVSLEDLVALDLEDIIPFSEHLAIRRIRGGVFIKNDPSTYVISITGPHFGGDVAGVVTAFDVSLNDVKLGTPDLKPPIDAIFTVKEEVLRELFKDDQLVILPLTIHVKRSQPRFMHFGWSTQEITLPYKVSLLPKYAGTVTITSEYPKYEWQSRGAINPITSTIRDDQAQAGYPMVSAVPNPALGAKPKPGDQKIDKGSLAVKCNPDMQPARQFPNAKIYPLSCIRSGSNPPWSVFEKGFVSTDWVGGGGDQPASYDSINNEFFRNFGFRISRSPILFRPASGPPPYLENRCAENGRCALSPSELEAHSQPTSMDVSSCPIMEWNPNETNWDLQDTKVTVFIRKKIGATLDVVCQRGGNATWQLSYDVLQYGPKADLGKKIETYKVYAGEPVEIPVLKSEGSGAVHSAIALNPIIGPSLSGIIPADLSSNFRSSPPTELDDRVVYTYTFQYPKLNIP